MAAVAAARACAPSDTPVTIDPVGRSDQPCEAVSQPRLCKRLANCLFRSGELEVDSVTPETPVLFVHPPPRQSGRAPRRGRRRKRPRKKWQCLDRDATDPCVAVQGGRKKRRCESTVLNMSATSGNAGGVTCLCRNKKGAMARRGCPVCSTPESYLPPSPDPGPAPTPSPAPTPQPQGVRTATVFGFKVIAAKYISHVKFLHAVSVLAEMLDNDADGCVDDEGVYQGVTRDRGPVALVLRREGSRDLNGHPFLRDVYDYVDVFDEEIKPDCSGVRANTECRDATLEEALHVVHMAFGSVYPEVFGYDRNPRKKPENRVLGCMRQARGGVVGPPPKKGVYPAGAWYHYDDATCDSACQVIEYLYWANTAYMDTQLGFCVDNPYVVREWELCTSDLLLEVDSCVYNLISNPSGTFGNYKLPQNTLKGSYARVRNGDLTAVDLSEGRCSARCCSPP